MPSKSKNTTKSALTATSADDTLLSAFFAHNRIPHQRSAYLPTVPLPVVSRTCHSQPAKSICLNRSIYPKGQEESGIAWGITAWLLILINEILLLANYMAVTMLVNCLS